jgi:NitT/TauT family transport system substrate-binding protein
MWRSFVVNTLAAAAVAALAGSAAAQDTLKVAIGGRGILDNTIPLLAEKAGIFKKHGLAVEILYTQGSGETLQSVISGSMDLGLSVGTLSALGASAKGAPIRIIAATKTGTGDLFWYVAANSPIKTMKDAEGKSFSIGTNGSSTNIIVLAFEKHFGVSLKKVASGGIPSTFTEVMSGQLDSGWSAPPFVLEAVDQGKVRIVARGDDVPMLRDQTVRVMVANAGALERRRDVFARYVQATRETVDWLFTHPDAVKTYADVAEIPLEVARRTRDEFQTRAGFDPDRISGLDQIMADAVAFKYLPAPLSKEQLGQLIQIPPKR